MTNKSEFRKELRRSKYEILFIWNWAKFSGVGTPDPIEEYVFAKPRRWRFDFAWPDQKLAVEIDGGQWIANGGRHNRDSDREKMNAATALGWRIFRFSGQQVKNNPIACVQQVEEALKGAR